MLLHDKIVIVTGATRGIGLAMATRAAIEGAQVILTGRSIDQLESACVAISTDHSQARVQPAVCDVTQEGDVKQLFQSVFKQFGRLDGLVNNAGVLEDALIGMVTRPQIDRVFDVNVFGLIHCCQYGSRLMQRSGSGSIVNVSSIIGVTGNVGQVVYGASKAAVVGVTRSLAKEMAPVNVRVNAIAPGLVDTDMVRSLPPEKYAERLAGVRMGRVGSPTEVANVAIFLMSDLASYVTGQVVGVDGGMVV